MKKVNRNGPILRDTGISVDLFNEQDLADAHSPFKLSIFNLPPGSMSAPDSHEVMEMWIVLGGIGVVSASNQTMEIDLGCSIAFDSHEVHQIRNIGTETLTVMSIWWNL